MKKRLSVKNLDCANCAAKMEGAISHLDGVNSVSLNFLAQKLVLDADGDRFEQILSEAESLCKQIDADFEIVR